LHTPKKKWLIQVECTIIKEGKDKILKWQHPLIGYVAELQRQNYENLFPFNFEQNLCHLKLETYRRIITF
jgi:hypothetical protein